MAMPELVVLPDFDVASGAVCKLQPAADQEFKAPPDVARPEQAQLQAAAAGEHGRDNGQAFEVLNQ